MKLYIYRSLDGERVPKDTTHAIVDDSVTIIKKRFFYECKHLVSLIMGDNVKRIEDEAFCCCRALRFIRLSKTLESIGRFAFWRCHALEALFLPSTLKSTVESIGLKAFFECQSLRLLIIPNGIHLHHLCDGIIEETAISHIARAAGAKYEYENDDVGYYTRIIESGRRVNEWLLHHMDISPFHKLCYDPSITTRRINDYLIENGKDSAIETDVIYGMTPLHMLAMNQSPCPT